MLSNTFRYFAAFLTTCILTTFLLLPISRAADNNSAGTQTNGAIGSYSGAAETIYPSWFKNSFLELEDDVAEAAEQGKRLMIIFHQDGCPYCNAFVERNLAQKDIEDTLKTKFDVIDINMWGDHEVASVDGNIYTEKSFAEALKVQFTPTILFLTETGSLALRINGYYNPDRFRVVLDYVSEKMEAKLSLAEYAAQFKSHDNEKSLAEYSYFSPHDEENPIVQGKNSRPYILFFEQTNCRNCQQLHDSVLATSETQELLSMFDVFQINMWGPEQIFTSDSKEPTTGRLLAERLNVSYAPTMILYSADGVEIIRSEAWFKKFHTQSIFDYVLSDGWKEQPNFQRFISSRADTLREEGVDVNIWD